MDKDMTNGSSKDTNVPGRDVNQIKSAGENTGTKANELHKDSDTSKAGLGKKDSGSNSSSETSKAELSKPKDPKDPNLEKGMGSDNAAPSNIKSSADKMQKGVENAATGTSDLKGARTLDSVAASGQSSEGAQKTPNAIHKAKKVSNTANKIQSATTTGAGAAKVGGAILLLNAVKTMALNMLILLLNLTTSVVSAVTGVLSTIASAIYSGLAYIGSAIASVFSVSTVAGTAVATAGAASLVVAGGGAAYTTIAPQDPAQYTGIVHDCQVDAKAASDAFNADAKEIELTEQATDNAKLVYGVFSAWGMSDVNIAAILGNWTAESGIDPTSIETMEGDRYNFGAEKTKAINADFLIRNIDIPKVKNYSAKYPKIVRLGIGLGQWTDVDDSKQGRDMGGRNTALRDYAKSIGRNWFDLEAQLGFMISKDSRAKVAKSFVANTNSGKDSVDAATVEFLKTWEGIMDHSLGRRKTAAGEWFAKFGAWEKNPDLAASIMQEANVALDSAKSDSVSQAYKACLTHTSNADNSNLANAMLSYALPNRAVAAASAKGSDLYIYLHDQVLKGDALYKSCDRSVATAVRWSDSDANFPYAGVQAQLNYVNQHPEKWEQVPYTPGDFSNIHPGDLMIGKAESYHGYRVSHIAMYVGNDAVKAAFKDFQGDWNKNANIAHGSLPNVAPHIAHTYADMTNSDTVFRIFRLIKPDDKVTYRNLEIPGGIRVRNTVLPSVKTNTNPAKPLKTSSGNLTHTFDSVSGR